MGKNQHAITPKLQELVKHVANGECILFIGAGVHAAPPPESGYEYPEEQRPPLGRDLSEKLAAEYGYKSKFPDDPCWDLQRVSLYIDTAKEKGLNRMILDDALDRLLRENKKPTPALRMLASMPFRIYVTTNYDTLLEAALRKFDKEPACLVYTPSSKEPTRDMVGDPTEKRPLLFKMHGDIDHRESIVITEDDYITFVQRMSDTDKFHPVPGTVRYRLQKWPTLFVGYSLRDFNLRLLFRTLRWGLDPSSIPPSFSVDMSPDPLILQVWQNATGILTFVAEDLWTFVPWLYKEIHGKEYEDEHQPSR